MALYIETSVYSRGVHGSGLFHLRIPPPPNKFLYLIGGGILIKYGILNNSKPHFFFRRFAAKITPNQLFLWSFGAPLGAPEKFYTFYFPPASFPFILRAIWTSKMIKFKGFSMDPYPQNRKNFPPAAGSK